MRERKYPWYYRDSIWIFIKDRQTDQEKKKKRSDDLRGIMFRKKVGCLAKRKREHITERRTVIESR